jgi:hypothetical protein
VHEDLPNVANFFAKFGRFEAFQTLRTRQRFMVLTLLLNQ